MRQKTVLLRRTVSLNVTLLNSTSFAAWYERISRKNLPGNTTVTRTRTIGPQKKRTRKKKARFALENTPTQDRARRKKKKYRKLRRTQTDCVIVGDLAKLSISMGSKATNSVLGKKLTGEGIKQVPNLYRYGTSEIKNINIQRALNSDIVNYVAEQSKKQTQNKEKKN